MTEQISVTRTFDAPRALVWEVVTGREHFAEWFGTDAVRVPLDTPGWSPDARAALVGGYHSFFDTMARIIERVR
ncbi:MAG: hypothetical protein KDB08_00170 [Microthrixaceae bacterium]|nr:hypothetical protein [Microthrixaceae bacterium]